MHLFYVEPNRKLTVRMVRYPCVAQCNELIWIPVLCACAVRAASQRTEKTYRWCRCRTSQGILITVSIIPTVKANHWQQHCCSRCQEVEQQKDLISYDLLRAWK
jgi:hypothetical protein